MHLVPISNIEKESFLAKTLYDIDDKQVLREGTCIIAELLEKIKNINVRTLYVSKKYHEDKIEAVMKKEIKSRVSTEIKELYYSL